MIEVDELRACADRRVRVRLVDQSEFVGCLRTELLTDLSISVFLTGDHGDGATIYIHEIAAISQP